MITGRSESVTLISIAGLSGCGKSTLAGNLARALGAEILSLDDYYRAFSNLTLEERYGINFDDPSSVDFPLLREHLHQLCVGNDVTVPSYDFVEFTRGIETKIVKPGQYLIIEGLFAMADEEVNAMVHHRFFIDVDPAVALPRRIQRDVLQRGRTPEEVQLRFNHHVLPMYKKYVEPSRVYSTRCIQSNRDAQSITEEALGMILIADPMH